MIDIDISKLPIPKISSLITNKQEKQKKKIGKKEKYLDSFYDKQFITKYFNEK